ncbi:Nitronate monooxygenase [Symbiodinium microadriaticum]|uniref:Nitronate monooxygenase n=1 Tax=Symbiodinium microadriaticum TaxID=2951 RepID=A0A1Q9D1Y8_SYMMI|nr:Nitronate monooxygenase [Symbiodinium microadriaticum]
MPFRFNPAAAEHLLGIKTLCSRTGQALQLAHPATEAAERLQARHNSQQNMVLKTKLTEALGIKHPIIQGGLTMSEFATLARRHARSTKIRSRSTGANRTSSAQMAARCDIPERILRRACSLVGLLAFSTVSRAFLDAAHSRVCLQAPLIWTARRAPAATQLAANDGDMFGHVADMFEGPAFEEGEQWRALTKIKVRKEPSINAPQMEDKVIEKGETFYVAEKRRAKIPTGGKNRLYLRLAAGKGWVFDLGVAGEWYGKPIAEPVYEDESDDSPNPFGEIGDAVGGMMHFVGYADMAAAVSNAGGLGIITALTVAQPPKGKEALRDEIRKCRQLTDKPFGVNITLLPVGVPPDFDGIVQVLIEEKVKVVETAGRNPEKVIKQCKDAGMFVIHKCVAVRHALTAQKMGADMISMDGFDCGGHPGEEDVGNWVLLAQASQELSIPFVASGGTATGVQLAAALAMGAEGINMGTRFMATKEAPIVQPIKDVMVKAKVTDTTHVFRSLKNTERVYKNKTAAEREGSSQPNWTANGCVVRLMDDPSKPKVLIHPNDELQFIPMLTACPELLPLLHAAGVASAAALAATCSSAAPVHAALPKVARAAPITGVLLARADYAQLLHCPDLSDGTWHEVPLPQGMPTYLSCAAAFYRDHIYIVGGGAPYLDGKVVRATCYNLKDGTWSELSPMPTARTQRLSPKVIGGKADDDQPLDTVEVFDLAQGEWECWLDSVVALGCDDQRTHLFCGDLAAKEWRSLPAMPRERWQPALLELAEYLITIGGMVHPDEDIGAVDVFDMRTGQWTSANHGLHVPDMPESRTDPAVCAHTGRVYVLGGMKAGPVETVECLDLWSRQWHRLPDMKEVQKLESEKPGDFFAIAHLVKGENYRKSFQETGDSESSVWSCGQSIGLIKDIPTCQELLDRWSRQRTSSEIGYSRSSEHQALIGCHAEFALLKRRSSSEELSLLATDVPPGAAISAVPAYANARLSSWVH